MYHWPKLSDTEQTARIYFTISKQTRKSNEKKTAGIKSKLQEQRPIKPNLINIQVSINSRLGSIICCEMSPFLDDYTTFQLKTLSSSLTLMVQLLLPLLLTLPR